MQGLRSLGVSVLPDSRIFNFTVRSFTILGCRWQPESHSIQLPVSCTFDESGIGKPRGPWRKKQVVCAFGPHINRLRAALEARLQVPKPEAEEEFEAVAAE